MKRKQNLDEQIRVERITGIGLVDKQTGGNGQYARVEVTVHPMQNSDSGNLVVNSIVGGTIPTPFVPSVIDGVNEGLKRGPLGGYPISGVIVTIIGGKSHPVDSNVQAFKEAGRLAVQNALNKSEIALLEPVARIDVVTPSEFLGTVIGDINRRRGQIVNMNTGDYGESTVQASVPLAETFGYSTALRSLTQGRASFTLEPQGYAEVPPALAVSVTGTRKTG